MKKLIVLLGLLIFATPAFAGVPAPINAPVTIPQGDTYCSTADKQQSFDCGPPPAFLGPLSTITTTGGDLSNYKSINFCGYYTCGDRGGSNFKYSATPCPQGVDGGSCIRDQIGNYFTSNDISDGYGLASVLKFGCKPDTVNGSGTPSTTCFNAAQTAALANGLSGINISGNSTGSSFLLDNGFVSKGSVVGAGAHQIRAPGTGSIGLPNTGYWGTNPNTLWIPTSKTLTCGIVAQKNCLLRGFSIIHSGVNGSGSGTVPTSLQDFKNIVSTYTGTGLTIAADSPDIQQINVGGFSNCVNANGPREGNVRDLALDCTSNMIRWQSQRGGGVITWDNIWAGCFITCLNSAASISLPLNGITDGAAFGHAGKLVVSLNAPCTDSLNCPQTGDNVYTTGAHSAESSGGQPFVITNLDNQNYLLPHATSAFLTGKNFTAATTNIAGNPAVGNTIIGWDTIQFSGISGTCPQDDNDWCQVQPNQQVFDLTNSGCLPSPTYVAYVDYHDGWIILKNAAGTAFSPATLLCDIHGHTIELLDNAFAFSVTSSTLADGGTGYTQADVDQILTVPGGTCTTQPTLKITAVNTSTGKVTTLYPDTNGVCSVFPPTPTGILSNGQTAGSGVSANIFYQGAVQEDTGQRAGVAFNFGNTITLNASNLFSINAGTGALFGSGSAGNTVTNLQIFTSQNLQNNFTNGIVLQGAAHENRVVGCSIHAYGANIVSQTTAGSNLGTNDIIGCSAGGNAKNSGQNQVLARIEGQTTGSNSQSTLKLDFGTNTTGAILVSSDIETPTGLKLQDTEAPNVDVFVQNPADSAAVDLGNSTLDRYTHGTPRVTAAIAGVSNPLVSSIPIPDCSPNNQFVYGTGASGSAAHVYFPVSPTLTCTIHTSVDKNLGVILELGSNKLSSVGGDLTGTQTLTGVSQLNSYIDFVFNGTRWIAKGDYAFLVANGLIPVPSGPHSVFTHPTDSSNTTLDGTARMRLCNATSGPVVYTVPLGSTVSGGYWTIKKVDASVNTCSVTMSGSDTLDGSTGSPSSGIISTQWGKLTIWNNTNNTTNWYIQ